MMFTDLRQFIQFLAIRCDLKRVWGEVDADQEVTILHHRELASGGKALLFERVKGSPYRLVTNLFGTRRRVEWAFGRPPAEIGGELAALAERLMPPTLKSLWANRRALWEASRVRLKTVAGGPILDECLTPPQLDRLPCLKCWPLDGGAFFTLPLVHTVDPVTGRGNLGIYRMQRFDAASTGMHWQIEKGGGFHFQQACALGQALPVSVFLGGPPALTLAAIAPLPEGVDERLLAAWIMGQPLEVVRRATTGHCIPIRAEFVLEGHITPGDVRREGPFGDHLGHYSHSADFPVYRVERLLARRGAVYPATVVGKPPQEDYFIGEALQELTLPLLKVIKPGIADAWAYPETGFHPLLVTAVKERYRREALKHAFALLGEGQLSLSKVLIAVDQGVQVRDFRAVSRALWEKLDEDGLYLLAPTAQDTLDFTGPAPNMGSRLILLAVGEPVPRARGAPPSPPPPARDVHPHLRELTAFGEAVLVAQADESADREAVRAALAVHPITRDYLFHVLVGSDVPLDDPCLILWGWFTRFDPLADLYPARREARGNRLILHFPILIDATWKPGYRQPVEFDEDVLRRVARKKDLWV